MTKDPALYQTERYDLQDFSYFIPLAEPGDYVLILKFSEIYFNSEGQKKFFVRIGDNYVVKDLDIYAHVGKTAAYDEFVEFNYDGEKVIINGKETKDAISNNQLKVDFIKSDKDNPKINAMLLINGSLKDTDYYLQAERIKKIQEKKELSKKRKPKVEKKVEDSEWDFEPVEQIVHEMENTSLIQILTSMPALVLMSVIGGLVLLACKNSPKNSKIP